MAENKKSFVLYTDLINIVKKFVEKDRIEKTNYGGELFLLILEYVNDKEPVPIDFILEMAFEPIKLQLKRDLDKYETVKKKRAEAGRNGGLKSGQSRSKTNQDEANEANASFVKQTEANEADNDSGNDTDTVNVNDNVILLEKETKKENITKEVPEENSSVDETNNEVIIETEEKEKSSAKKEKPPEEPEDPKAKIFFFKKAMIAYGFDETLTDHFIAVRKKKRLVNTEIAFNNFIREIEKTGKDPNEVFEIITKKQWGGFEAKWLKNLDNGQFTTNNTSNGFNNNGNSSGKINGRSDPFTIEDFISPSTNS